MAAAIVSMWAFQSWIGTIYSISGSGPHLRVKESSGAWKGPSHQRGASNSPSASPRLVQVPERRYFWTHSCARPSRAAFRAEWKSQPVGGLPVDQKIASQSGCSVRRCFHCGWMTSTGIWWGIQNRPVEAPIQAGRRTIVALPPERPAGIPTISTRMAAWQAAALSRRCSWSTFPLACDDSLH